MEPEDLIHFLDYVKDIKGYLMALMVNFVGAEEKVGRYYNFLSDVGEKEVDPIDFYECITELYSILGVLVTAFPKTEGEILPCIKTIDELRKMLRTGPK